MKLFHILTRRALVAVLTLPVCLATGYAAIDTPPTGYSAATLFNRANACAREGKSGLAILNYERARLLSPNDADIAANLHFVRAKAGLPDAPESWITRNLACARPNTWAWLGSFGLVLTGMSLILLRLHPRRRLIFRLLTVTGALVVAMAVGSAITLWPSLNEAVVITREAPARVSPALVAEPAFELREGETVTVRAECQDFTLVQTSTGRSGWVPRADLTFVVPHSRNQV